MQRAVATLALCLLLAGCGGKAGTGGGAAGAHEAPLLQGYVFDAAVRPVANANVTIQGVGVTGRNATAATAADGHYAFHALPVDQRLVVIVQAAGLKSLSKQVSLSSGNSTMLNFTLDAVPTQKPYSEPVGFNGFIGCETATTAQGQTQTTDCGGTLNRRVWVFNVNPGCTGIVIETAWVPTSPAAQFLHAVVSTVGLGDQQAVLAEVTDASVLKAVVGQAQCEKYYPQGGTVQVVWSADANAANQEAGVGAAAAFQQDFRAVATAFFVAPPPPDFSAA
ncbi:MAG: Carboxypeptidase regulatory-like domain [Thermoplasmata archaeon]|jgi:hypothetical protein|nr:Carboxypeptidase regulatory-like domain [Thermoplasmata archaeon]